MKFHPKTLLLLFSGLILILLLPWQLIPHNVDNAWYLSMYYNPIIKELPSNATFGSGNGALPWFGKSLLPLYSLWFSLFGWDLLPALLLSRIFLLLGGLMFFASFLKSGLSRFTSVLLSLTLMSSEPLLMAGGFIRPESFLFMMAGVISFLVLCGHRFLPVLLSFLCFEVHPSAILLLPFVWLLIFRFGVENKNDSKIKISGHPVQGSITNRGSGKTWRLDPGSIISADLLTRAWRFIVINCAGGSAAILFYLSLHPGTFTGFISNIQGGVAATSGTALTQLFTFNHILPGNEGLNVIWSRIVELLCWVLILIGTFYWSWKKKVWFPPLLTGWIFIADFLNPKGNQHYSVYYAIFLVWAFSELIRNRQFFLPALAGLTVLVFSVWKVSYVASHSESVFTISNKFGNSRSLISKQLPKTSVILGSPEAWFIYRDYNFYASAYTGICPEWPDTLFLTNESVWTTSPAGFSPKPVLDELQTGFLKNSEPATLSIHLEKWSRKNPGLP